MGIRYSRDTQKATNGPMLFFSDPSAQLNLSDEIRGAISSRLSFYAYRLPGDKMISFGSSEGYLEGIGIPGFVISPFDSRKTAITIPYKPSAKMIRQGGGNLSIPTHSTSRKEHEAEIEAIQKALSKVGNGKIVAARAIAKTGKVDVGATFSELCHNYPSAFVFVFSTPATGCWLGASPELLLEGSCRGMETMSLAGTRPVDSSEDWDDKNIEEQAMVTNFIIHCLEKHGLSAYKGETFSKEAGNMEHICTPIYVSTQESGNFDPLCLQRLLSDLSPTPALCGWPRDIAFSTIIESENFDRGCYGGFCGPYQSAKDFHFYVNLRCAQADAVHYALYVGGGITLKSEASKEWEETELKTTTLQSCLEFDSP